VFVLYFKKNTVTVTPPTAHVWLHTPEVKGFGPLRLSPTVETQIRDPNGGIGLHRLEPPWRKNFISNGDPIPSIVHDAASPGPCRGGPASPLPVELELEPPPLPVREEKGEGAEEPRRGGVELKLEPPPLFL
jgi:hypothetical protein